VQVGYGAVCSVAYHDGFSMSKRIVYSGMIFEKVDESVACVDPQ